MIKEVEINTSGFQRDYSHSETPGWETKRIEDIAIVRTGGTPNRENQKYWENGTIPWMSSGEINFKQIYNVKEKITELGFNNSNTSLLPPGTVMIAMNGQGKTRGSVALLHCETTCNQSLAGIITKKGYDNTYLFYYLEFSYEKLRNITGEGRSGLNLSLIKNFEVSFPMFKVQQKIARILSAVDEQIEKTEKIIRKTKELKKGLMQKIFTKGIGHTNFKNTDLGEAPVNWEVVQFNELCSRIIVGIASSTSKYYTKEKAVPILRNQNIKENKVKAEDVLYITKEFDEMNYKKRLRKGDLLTVRTGYPGLTAVVPKEFEEAQSFTTLISSPKSEIANSEYLAYYMNSAIGKKELTGLSAGGAQQNLNVNSLSNFRVKLPPIFEQNKIVNILSAVDQQIDSYEKEKDKQIELKKALMQQLLTGEIEVTV